MQGDYYTAWSFGSGDGSRYPAGNEDAVPARILRVSLVTVVGIFIPVKVPWRAGRSTATVASQQRYCFGLPRYLQNLGAGKGEACQPRSC